MTQILNITNKMMYTNSLKCDRVNQYTLVKGSNENIGITSGILIS